MKRGILLTIVVAALSMPLAAQSYQNSRYYNPNSGRLDYSSGHHSLGIDVGDAYYGFRIGPSFSTVHSGIPELDANSSQTGLTLALLTGIPLTNKVPLYFELGLMYTEKGGKQKWEGDKLVYNLNYLEIPLVIKYVYEIGSDFSIQPMFGGYLACGVGGKTKNYDARTVVHSFSKDMYRRFDGGLRIGCGVGFNVAYVDLVYDIGLANICHDSFESTHNGCLYIDFGVNF
ncbi:MAG: PorT family protein [Prevotella sp.]|nr:PorT family protein [Prevotella sp.]